MVSRYMALIGWLLDAWKLFRYYKWGRDGKLMVVKFLIFLEQGEGHWYFFEKNWKFKKILRIKKNEKNIFFSLF